MGVGLAQATLDYVREHRPPTPGGADQDRLVRIDRRIDAVRRLTFAAAHAVDRDPDSGYLANAAKHQAAQLAEHVTLAALRRFGPGARVEHPLLDKFARDARGLEFMEGTGNIQRLSLFGGLRRGALDEHLGRGATPA
jgi:alkylation response protein AidB-like acyl-CoA dehydrogenase